MCKAHVKVTHIKQQIYFHHLKGHGYNKNSVLYPGRLRWWKYICCFICVTLIWALHIVIKQQFFNIYLAIHPLVWVGKCMSALVQFLLLCHLSNWAFLMIAVMCLTWIVTYVHHWHFSPGWSDPKCTILSVTFKKSNPIQWGAWLPLWPVWITDVSDLDSLGLIATVTCVNHWCLWPRQPGFDCH